MKRKRMAILLAFALVLTMAACGAGEETTLSGMVVFVEGTVISVVEIDASGMGGRDFAEGERPTLPEGETFPQRGEGERPTLPEGETFPQHGEGEKSEMPEGMQPPEGMTMPENGDRPDFPGENGSGRPGFGNFGADVEAKKIDIANAHISLEIDGGKATGSMEDIKPGTFVTVTLNGKGKATNVLVSSRAGFGGGRRSES